MKRFSLLLMMFITGIASYAAVVQGTVIDQNNQPVPNTIVYVTDSANSSPLFTLQATTNASGFYSVTLPSTVPTGTSILAYTYGCGIIMSNFHSYTGANITSNFTICTTTTTGPDTISGTVTLPSSNPSSTVPAYPAVVYLIHQYYDSVSNGMMLVARDSTNTNMQGYYEFLYSVNVNDTLLVKAALTPNTPNYPNYLPTYHTSSLSWNSATMATLVSGANNIQMLAGVNPGGPGFIGGSVLQGANKTTAPGDPLSQRILLLTNMSNTPVAYAYSDANGDFSFPSIAYGTYKLFGDVMGKLNPALIVTVDASNHTVTNIIFEENSTDFTGHFNTTSVGNVSTLAFVQCYPNPVVDQLTISGLEAYRGTKAITVQNLSGATVFSTSTDKAKVIVPTSQLAEGIYILKVHTSEGTGTYKIIR